jgi:hypothetical protein
MARARLPARNGERWFRRAPDLIFLACNNFHFMVFSRLDLVKRHLAKASLRASLNVEGRFAKYQFLIFAHMAIINLLRTEIAELEQ